MTFRTSSDVRASITSDGLVLLDVNGGLLLASNAIGGRIWQRLEERHAPSEIADELAREFAEPIDRTRRHVEAFVAALVARGLIVPEPAGAQRC